jgi:hypothetical protein
MFEQLSRPMMTLLAVFLAAGLLTVEPGLRASQSASAVAWQQIWSNQGVWCEGCCAEGLCCSINAACKHEVQ